ncbi:type VI secretion system lipoprotein TssJ [Enterobacterales bacterium CwR94]|nr:type VI secretion system lipoprotein TssJ [Enterobacterales bacterium CwR94]
MATVLTLSGCGVQQAVVDGSVSAFDAVFYKQIKTLRLDFTARESLNSDAREHNPLSEPVMVRVYQLKTRKSVDATVYQQLTTEEADALQDDLLAQRDLVVTPGGAVSLTMPMEKDAHFVAVAALFQHPDLKNNTWRLVLSRSDLNADKPRTIELDSRHLQLREEQP